MECLLRSDGTGWNGEQSAPSFTPSRVLLIVASDHDKKPALRSIGKKRTMNGASPHVPLPSVVRLVPPLRIEAASFVRCSLSSRMTIAVPVSLRGLVDLPSTSRLKSKPSVHYPHPIEHEVNGDEQVLTVDVSSEEAEMIVSIPESLASTAEIERDSKSAIVLTEEATFTEDDILNFLSDVQSSTLESAPTRLNGRLPAGAHPVAPSFVTEFDHFEEMLSCLSTPDQRNNRLQHSACGQLPSSRSTDDLQTDSRKPTQARDAAANIDSACFEFVPLSATLCQPFVLHRADIGQYPAGGEYAPVEQRRTCLHETVPPSGSCPSAGSISPPDPARLAVSRKGLTHAARIGRTLAALFEYEPATGV